ncbi:MAG: hypothetical protein ACOWYE_08410 [Desulfatiglandales bacterium]
MKKGIIGVMALVFLLGAGVPGFAQDFSTSDLEGEWWYFVTEVNPTLPGVYWLTGTGEMDASGNLGGVYVAPDGSAVAITGGQMVVARNGTLKGTLLAETGDTVTLVDGKLDQSKTFGTAVMVGSDNTMDITTMIKAGGTFTPADMEGQWYAYVTALDTATGAAYWVYGTLDVDNAGNVTGTLNAPDGSTVSVTGGTLSLDENGILTGSTTLSTGDTATVQGKLDQGKTFGAYVSAGMDQSMRIGYLHKAGGTFEPDEGQGSWYAYGLNIEPSIPAVFWLRGRSVMDASGYMNGAMIAPTGQSMRAKGSTALDSDGVWTGTLQIDGDMAIGQSAKLDLNRSSLTGVLLSGSGGMGLWHFLKESPYLYFPHVASDGVWETEIGMINDSDTQTINGELVAYSNSGAEVSRMNVSLMPNGRRSVIIGDAFSNPSQIGYLIFQSDKYVRKGYTKFYIDGKYRVAVPAVSTINMEEIYVSHIASDHEWWTGVSLLNTNAEAKEIVIEFNTGATVSRTLAAFEHQAFYVRDLFNGTTPAGIESAVIRNADGIVGLELFGSTETSTRNYLSGILLTDDTATDIYYPHVASDTDWWTGIAAYNPADTSTILDITTYDQAGNILDMSNLPLPAGGKYLGLASELEFPAETAWFSIHAGVPITGFELFGTTNDKQLGGYVGVGIQKTEGVFAKIEKDGWTGIAFVNTGNVTAAVDIAAYDDSGTLIASESLGLAPYEKVVGMAGSLFSDDIDTATYITFSASAKVVGFQLNGSSDGMMLDGLPGM